jgi:LysR family hydrogen peroxide-inducible transcriptional activator
LKHDVVGHLPVGAVPTIALYVLPTLIGEFQRRYPKVIFEIFEDTTENLAAHLEDGTLDVVLASAGVGDTSRLERHSLGEEPLLILLSQKHRHVHQYRYEHSDPELNRIQLLELALSARPSSIFGYSTATLGLR